MSGKSEGHGSRTECLVGAIICAPHRILSQSSILSLNTDCSSWRLHGSTWRFWMHILDFLEKRDFQKHTGTSLGIHTTRIMVSWAPFWGGCPIFGNSQTIRSRSPNNSKSRGSRIEPQPTISSGCSLSDSDPTVPSGSKVPKCGV